MHNTELGMEFRKERLKYSTPIIKTQTEVSGSAVVIVGVCIALLVLSYSTKTKKGSIPTSK